ncbi:hypothetical protein M569_14397, partial [Genlisea aurea]
RRKKSPIKNVVASINRSVYNCHRRLIKIFKKLVRVTTTPKRTPRKNGYRPLGKPPPETASAKRSLLFSVALPPPPCPGKKTVFLDLDETLVHSTVNLPPEKYDFIVRPVLEGKPVDFYVLKRPFLDEFLTFLSSRYEVAVFTAGIEEYASLVVDGLDRRKLISHRLYRDSCREMDGQFVKDLSEIGRELKRVVIVDDNPFSYRFQPENAVPIKPFTDDLEDDELRKLIHFFQEVEEAEDVRES